MVNSLKDRFYLASGNPSIISNYEIIFSHTVHLHARRQRSLKSGRDAQNLGVQLKSGIKEDVAAQKCLFGMNLGNFRFYILHLYPLNHSMSSSCGISTKEIWAAYFWQTFRAELEWFWAASPTATVQVNTKKVKLNILSLIFSSWNSLYTKNKNYQT